MRFHRPSIGYVNRRGSEGTTKKDKTPRCSHDKVDWRRAREVDVRAYEDLVHEIDPADPITLPDWIRIPVSRLDFGAIAQRNCRLTLPRFFRAAEESEQFRAALFAAAEENLEALRAVVSGEASFASVHPEHGKLAASIKARFDVTNTQMHRAYRWAADRVFWDCLKAMEAVIDETKVAGCEIVPGILAFTQMFAEWRDRIIDPASEVHRLGEEKLRGSPEHLRRDAVRALLRGDSVESAVNLHYDMTATHIAIFLPHCSEAAARPVVNLLRQALHVTGHLVVPFSISSTMAWLTTNRSLTPSWREAVKGCLEQFEVAASVSEPSSGLEGFRRTFQETNAVEELRTYAGVAASRILLYHNVRLECFFLTDRAAARAFVEAELGELRGTSPMKQELRATVSLFLEKGSIVAAAADLVLHEHTVRNRLRRAEEYLRHPLTSRRAEVQVALRLYNFAMVDDGS
ncbi:PucR family transcriptional regulator [Amycolatopsis pithecellobii]|uniref:PucR C-terminal helix-turn-helix domain-containing protein n=1 Tax=Amycolatopsis pithecellobii TaxID=664692 RepID=A0A6N7Z6S0_9PSEU|nr:PucR family transcriptional regulator [Amycolatopsis pithecellobii]MTD56540.1 hypothetical protein [Amycolatopsis pithecellobii]